jgi:hypothetical protein
MRIRRLKIHNFRDIRDLHIVCHDAAGTRASKRGNESQSRLDEAIDFALQVWSPLDAGDFCPFRDPLDDKLWVELTIADLTVGERKELRRHVTTQGTVMVRKTATLLGNGGTAVRYAT